MTGGFGLAVAQLNPVMGDISGNMAKLRKVRQEAAQAGAQLLMTSELYLCGYPPEDLVLKTSFQKALRDGIEALAKDTADGGPALLLGTPWAEGERLYNAALLLEGGKIAAKVFKCDLPNYGPFDEKRIFAPGPLPEPMSFRGMKLGAMVCEDMWTPEAAGQLKQKGANLLLVPNGSPYETGKKQRREELARARVQETGLSLVYVNQVGGQDELVFDGNSFVLDAKGVCVQHAKAWEEELIYLHFPIASSKSPSPWGGVRGGVTVDVLREHADSSQSFLADPPPNLPPRGEGLLCASLKEKCFSDEETIYNALMLGLRDYVGKNGFPGVVLGLSGGIDSALAAVLAADALGPDKLWCVMMPSPFTSKESHEDAEALAHHLHCRYDVLPIAESMEAFGSTLKSVFTGKAADVTEENIQARCRGILLMALSNKFGPMVLSTGNKSEMSVGYSTLYGDLCGGFAVLKDVYKTQVYKIARWRNAHKPATALGPDGAIIPDNIFTRAPTAELRPNQTDQDSLPPYDVLDAILECLIEKDMGVRDIAACGHDIEIVNRVWSMLDRAEYKRRQAPPGVKITNRALSRDRRYPITNRYRETD